MAISGSVTTAYRIWLSDVKLCMVSTSTMRDLCDKPNVAINRVRSGLVATVAGSDVDAVRMAVTKELAK